MLKNKNASSATLAIWLVVIVLIIITGGLTIYTKGFGLWAPEPEITAKEAARETAQATNVGDIASLKYSVESISEDSPVQFAGTGYCWDKLTPTQLIESRNGKTLSASAGTSFSPAKRGSNYECTAFSSTHNCEHDSGPMDGDTLELRSKCKNVTGSGFGTKLTLYEDGTAETTNDLVIGAGGGNNFNKFLFEVNLSNFAFPLKAICMGTNDSSSDLKKDSYKIQNWNKETDIPDSLGASADDSCHYLSSAVVLNEWESKEFTDTISLEADTDDPTGEVITMTFYDECEYVADDGSVKKDYFKRNTDSQGDCGATNPTYTFTVT